MRRLALMAAMVCIPTFSLAGFKAKNVKPKKPEQFQTRVTVAGVTYAADMLLQEKEQKEFFYKELTLFDIFAIRLAVFNKGSSEVAMPVEDFHLYAPDGTEVAAVDPDAVAEKVFEVLDVASDIKKRNPPVALGPGPRTNDPRLDPRDPRYDPTLDPNDPRYNPNDPRYNPNDPRNDPRNDPNGGPWNRPNTGVVLNPAGGSVDTTGDVSQYEKALVEKDFSDKAHHPEPVLPSYTRDKFLYYSVTEIPASARGYTLRLPAGNGRPEEVVLRF
jgi:hypothetical protein